MRVSLVILGLIFFMVIGFSEEIGLKMDANLRVGSFYLEDESGFENSRVSIGGWVEVESKPINGFSLKTKFYTTNPILGSENASYSILGEAYLQAILGETTIKAGRQVVDIPYIDSDDIEIIPNTYRGYTINNQDITNTTITLSWLDKWAGVDAPIEDRFTNMQDSSSAIFTGGVVYDGFRDIRLQAWHYKLDEKRFKYIEVEYKNNIFDILGQYSDQDKSNRVFGLLMGVNFDNFRLNTAYNRVDGEVIDGFGGGPFFTSAEEITIAESKNQEAIMVGVEYNYKRFTTTINYVDFKIGENEIDYLLSYAFNDKMSLDLIYSNMYRDGKMAKFFANYSF